MATLRHRRPVAIMAVAIVAVVGVVALPIWQADAAPGDDASSFVPIAPCRLFDYRPAPFTVGTRTSALGPAETHLQQVTGDVGNCDIPDGITAVSLNVAVLQGTASSYLVLFPANLTSAPLASSLNWVAGQPPTPNKVDVRVSDNGAIKLHNAFGKVYVLADAVGYYTSESLMDMDARTVALETASTQATDRLDSLEAENAELRSRLEGLEMLTASMTLEKVDGYPVVRFTGVNLQVVDGSGFTGGEVNGVGNLIVGYNENYRDVPDEDFVNVRTGSHNLVIGRYHNYSSWSGLVAGDSNTLDGFIASVTGGGGNTAGDYATVTGGLANTASGWGASVTGGARNAAEGNSTSVTGGNDNVATGHNASITGGLENTASGNDSAVVGGFHNDAAGNHETVLGGEGITCDDLDDFDAVVCGEGAVDPPDSP
jgi:hypothetical protein